MIKATATRYDDFLNLSRNLGVQKVYHWQGQVDDDPLGAEIARVYGVGPGVLVAAKDIPWNSSLGAELTLQDFPGAANVNLTYRFEMEI